MRPFVKSLSVITLFCFALIGFATGFTSFGAQAQDYENSRTSSGQSLSDKSQDLIAKIFDNLETIGSSANSSGHAASLAALDTGCRAALEQTMKTRLFSELKSNLSADLPLPSEINALINAKLQALGQTSLNQLCAALKGEQLQVPASADSLKAEFIPQIASWGQSYAQGTGFPFLSRLEIETSTSERSWVGAITSIQPLWQDANDLHHVFAQVSWHKAPDTTSDSGERTQYDTYNAGLAYRYLTADKNYLYGANMFLDYAPKRDHSRMSLGLDARTSQLAFSANRYMPLSTWRNVNTYEEERAAAGWDAELRGQIPELPSWTAVFKTYQWDGFEEDSKLYGAQAAVEYSPVPALTARLGVRDESEGSASIEAALRFNWRFDQPEALQLKERTELAPVSDYVYEKVQRDNIIRVKQRRKHSTKLTVIETSGANSALETSITSSLRVGQTLLMPVTITTANTVGAIVRLRFNDGSVLTSGQNTQVQIEPNLITLLTGAIQYVNNGVIQTIIVPGGTITLHGTDLDVVSDGTDSSVRVRDGAVTFTGSVSGTADLAPEDMAQSVTGVVGAVPQGTADYNSHSDSICTIIDWVAAPQNGVKVAPYIYEEPFIVSQNLTPGQQIILGLRFNDPVLVSGGTPLLNLTVNGASRTATYNSGTGTSELRFAYTIMAGDAGATNITVTDMDKNGASVMGNGKDAVTTIADTTLALSGSIADSTAPSGYSVTFLTNPVNNANKTAATLRITSGEITSTYTYTISSSGGGTPVTGSGTVTAAPHNITGINLSGLNDGTLTVSLTLTDTSSNAGTPVTATGTKDATPPSGYAAAFTTSLITSANKAAAAFNITGAEIGATYAYTISSSGGGTNVTGTGTAGAATHSVTGLDLSGLNDGTYTISLTMTDTNGNTGTPFTSTALADTTAPSGYAAAFTTSPINNSNKTAAAFNITSAEVGATYAYTISSSGGGINVTGSGTIGAATQSVTGLDVSGLNDGTLTVSVTLTDSNSNAGTATTATVTKDIAPPAGYSVTFTTDPVNLGNYTTAAFQFAAAEVGATYTYTISSSGGGTNVTGSGTIATATDTISALNLSGLNDGTLTVSVTLTDSNSNTGAAAADTVVKDIVAPTITSVTVTSGTYEP